uniref:Uncharacterized protein n=1 Tax=Lutzomyia longipalpis TaxID=7200 RepID=A0A1B0GKN8_LUTLO
MSCNDDLAPTESDMGPRPPQNGAMDTDALRECYSDAPQYNLSLYGFCLSLEAMSRYVGQINRVYGGISFEPFFFAICRETHDAQWDGKTTPSYQYEEK